MTDNAPSTLAEVRAEYVRQGQRVASLMPEGGQPYLNGKTLGWRTALAILDGLPPELCGEHALETLADALNENRRRHLALTSPATIHPQNKSGRVDALGDAMDLAVQASERAAARPTPEHPSPPHPAVEALFPGRFEGDEDLSDWTGYPAVPMDDVVMQGPADLAMFLGGDESSFTGDLIRLINKADPENLNRIAAGFPRHVRAWVLFQACQPVPARTLVALLEASDMLNRRRH